MDFDPCINVEHSVKLNNDIMEWGSEWVEDLDFGWGCIVKFLM